MSEVVSNLADYFKVMQHVVTNPTESMRHLVAIGE